MISFNNNGNGACLNQLHLPAPALEFLGEIGAAGVRSTFLDWARAAKKARRNDWVDELCNSVEGRRSLGPFLFALVRGGRSRRLRKEDYKVLEIYEDVALRKKERFDALQRVASKIRQMPGRYSEPLIKRLGNLGSKRTLLDLLKDYCKKESAGLNITPGELRVISDGPPNETASLLYLLCVAEEEGGQQ